MMNRLIILKGIRTYIHDLLQRFPITGYTQQAVSGLMTDYNFPHPKSILENDPQKINS